MTATTDAIRDARLPQLHVARNAAMMQTVLESALHCQIERCRILQCRYKPTKTCLVSYALTTPDSRQERIVYVRLYPENESFAQYQKARAKASRSQHVLHVPALEMVVWVFPQDRKLTSLGDVTDETRLHTEILPSVITASFGADWRIAALQSDIVHYVAEHTCTVKAQLEIVNAVTGKRRTPVLFGKTYYNEQGAATWQAMRQLQQSGIRIARALSYQPQLKTLWQLGLTGVTLDEAPSFENLLGKAAVAVAALHETPLEAHARDARSQAVAKLQAAAQLVALVEPERNWEPLLARLQAQAETRAARPAVMLHGDLHWKNFFVENDQIVLLDLDNFGAGDPLADLGSFLASLHYRHLLGELSNVNALINTFVNAYQASVSWAVPEADLRWHVATALVTERVARCITRLKASHLIDDLLALATRISAGGER
jgi:thiamine kinase-like enzyme